MPNVVTSWRLLVGLVDVGVQILTSHILGPHTAAVTVWPPPTRPRPGRVRCRVVLALDSPGGPARACRSAWQSGLCMLSGWWLRRLQRCDVVHVNGLMLCRRGPDIRWWRGP